MGRYTTGGVGRDVIAGAIAGGAAVWLISKMDWSLTHSGRAGAAPGPAHAAAAKAADAAGVSIDDKQKSVAGHTVHYGVGIGVGALYGLLRGMAPSVTTGRGSLYGVAAFILGDEIGTPALGLAKGPLDYPARDHAKSALSHVVFGLLTDLGTRLLAPWKNNVVIERGPSIQERLEGGRQAIADGRDYLYDQARSYADLAADYAERARDQVDELDLPGLAETGRKRARRFAEDLRSRLPDPDDISDVVQEGRRRARRFAGSVASQLPDQDDVSEVLERGRKRARSWAKTASDNLPDRDDVSDAIEQGRSRGRGWFRSLSDRLPDRDDVDDMVEQGRKRAQKHAKRAKKRLPDRDDVDDAVADGRKRVKRLAQDARESGESGFNRLTRWLFG